MHYQELTITLLLRKDLHNRNALEKLGEMLNHAMLDHPELKELHGMSGYKFYVYNNLFPLEKTGVYREGNIYVVRVRSMKDDFISKLKPVLRHVQHPYFQVIAIENHRVQQRQIYELYTLTPFIVTVDGQPWLVQKDDLDLLIERLHANAEKKYKQLYGEEYQGYQPFIQRLEILNSKPIGNSYKGITLLGNKAKIVVNEDTWSQKLAFVTLGSGLGEKGSSLGGGYCLANFI